MTSAARIDPCLLFSRDSNTTNDITDEDCGPLSLQSICESSIAEHMVDPFSVLQVMQYADAAGAELLCDHCSDVASLNLDAVISEHPNVLPELSPNLLELLELKYKSYTKMREILPSRPDIIELTPLEGSLCPTQANVQLGDFDYHQEQRVPSETNDIAMIPQKIEDRSFTGASDGPEMEHSEEKRKIRRMIFKKIQQVNQLEERRNSGEDLDAQQMTKINQKGVILSALAALDGGVPHEEVNALLRAASQAVVESQAASASHIENTGASKNIKSTQKMIPVPIGRLKPRKKGKSKDLGGKQSPEVQQTPSSIPGYTPSPSQVVETGTDLNPLVKHIGFQTTELGAKSMALNSADRARKPSRKGGLSMFLRGDLDTTKPQKPVWGVSLASPTNTPSTMRSIISEESNCGESSSSKTPNSQGPKGSKKPLGVKISLQDYLRGVTPYQETSESVKERAAWKKKSAADLGSAKPLLTIQQEQEEIRAATRKIPCPPPSYSRVATHDGSPGTSFGQSPTRTGFVFSGSPSQRGFVASPQPTVNRWYIREEHEIAVARTKSLREIQEEEKALKELEQMYGSVKIENFQAAPEEQTSNKDRRRRRRGKVNKE